MAEGIDQSEIRYLGDLQRLTLKPGDVLVLSMKPRVDHATREYLRTTLQGVVPGHVVIVLDSDMQIGVLGKEQEGA